MSSLIVPTRRIPSSPAEQRGLIPRSESPKKNRKGFFWSFLLGLGSRLEVQLIGFLPFSEIAVLALTPFLLPKTTSRSALKTAGWLLPLALLWLGNQVLTDIYRETAWSLGARGAARVVILIVAIPFFIVTMRENAHTKLMGFYAGATISAYLSGHIFKSGARVGRELVMGKYAELTWETYWGPIVLLAIALASLIFYKRSHILAYAINLGGAAVQLYGGSRSIAGMMMLGPALTAAANLSQSKSFSFRANRSRTIFAVGVASIIAIAGVFYVYSWAAQSGALGERALIKFQQQSRHKLGLLFGGRGDVLCAALAIYDSPIIGHGSWPRDSQGYFARACELTDTKMPVDYYKGAYPLIVSHSHIMQAWMEAGFLGGLFWLYVLAIVGKCMVSPFKDRERLQLWAGTVATGMAWNICFSPISARLDVAMVLAVFLTQTAELAAPAAESFRSPRLRSGSRSALPAA